MSTASSTASVSTASQQLTQEDYSDRDKYPYNYDVVRKFVIATVVWGVVGMAVGVLIAFQLVFPELNFDTSWLTFSRLRPLHTNAVIFAFGGCALMGTSFYVVQRTCQARLVSDKLANAVFWGWNLLIVLAAITLPMGLTTTKEYAELEWPLDILLAVVWIMYGIVYFGTIMKRKTSHIYVANWFYGGFILTVGVLHIVNSAALPVSLGKSYSVYSGATDAMVQWWYGHNAVGFFLTAGFLGMMYYFVPNATAHLFLSFVYRAFLGAGYYLYLGRTASPDVHRPARLDPIAGYGDVADFARSVVGWHD